MRPFTNRCPPPSPAARPCSPWPPGHTPAKASTAQSWTPCSSPPQSDGKDGSSNTPGASGAPTPARPRPKSTTTTTPLLAPRPLPRPPRSLDSYRRFLDALPGRSPKLAVGDPRHDSPELPPGTLPWDRLISSRSPAARPKSPGRTGQGQPVHLALARRPAVVRDDRDPAAVRVRPQAQGDLPSPGDKAGNWDGWYREAIPLADERFTQHLTELVADESRKR